MSAPTYFSTLIYTNILLDYYVIVILALFYFLECSKEWLKEWYMIHNEHLYLEYRVGPN